VILTLESVKEAGQTEQHRRQLWSNAATVGFWPIGEVHGHPLIQCTTGSGATSAEEVKREAN
jgi:hypothetical protein